MRGSERTARQARRGRAAPSHSGAGHRGPRLLPERKVTFQGCGPENSLFRTAEATLSRKSFPIVVTQIGL